LLRSEATIGMRSPSPFIPAAATAALLAACAGAPSETGRVVQHDPTTVSDRIESEMRSLGLAPTMGEDRVISARSTNAPSAWASCGLAMVGRGGTNKSSRAVSAGSRNAAIRVALTPAGDATKVDITARFAATYYNPETAGSFEQSCRTRGVLEARLLAAAG
jgi:hypothetical protein